MENLLHFILGLTKGELEAVLTTYDIKRLDLYSRNMVDYHLITDLLPAGKELKICWLWVIFQIATNTTALKVNNNNNNNNNKKLYYQITLLFFFRSFKDVFPSEAGLWPFCSSISKCNVNLVTRSPLLNFRSVFLFLASCSYISL